MKKGKEKKESLKNTKKSKDSKVANVSTKKTKHYIAEKKNVKVKKEKRDNVFKIVVKYFKGVGKEAKRIRWTDGKELVKYSVCTLAFVFFFGVYFHAIDWLVLLIRELAK